MLLTEQIHPGNNQPMNTYTVFSGDELIASGDLATILRASKELNDRSPDAPLLIFENETGRQTDFNLQGNIDQILEREGAVQSARGPGRPKLGVVSREVTLLPRHWDWLADQRGGASAALRRLVDEARRNESPRDRARQAAAAVGRMMTVLAGDRPNFEEAYRALDAGDRERFRDLTGSWPEAIRAHLSEQAERVFG